MPARTRSPFDERRALGAAVRGRGPRLACALLLVLAAAGCRKQQATPGREGDGTATATADGGTTTATPGAVPGPAPGAEATSTSTADATTDGGDVEPGAVLPAIFLSRQRTESFVGSFLLPDSRPVDAVWQPEQDDLDRLLADLPARLEADRDGRGREIAARLRAQQAGRQPDAAWDRYGVQVVGVVSGERRLVYANFYCNPEQALRSDPEELVLVLDGGTCFFQVWFDVRTGEYPRVAINGEA